MKYVLSFSLLQLPDSLSICSTDNFLSILNTQQEAHAIAQRTSFTLTKSFPDSS